jgi:hypothetical protein
MKKISVFIFAVLVLFSCSEKTPDLIYLISKDSIQHWNYEWKRNFPDEFGKTYSFNKNGELLQYLYIKKNKKRVIYKNAFRNPKKWSVVADSSFVINGDIFRIIYYNKDTIRLVNSRFNDTSLLLRTNTKFDVLIKTDLDDYILHPVSKDTVWIYSF